MKKDLRGNKKRKKKWKENNGTSSQRLSDIVKWC